MGKTEDGVTKRYLYDGPNIIAILDQNNNIIATITHYPTIDTPLSITNQNGTFYYHRDHQGSIIALTDQNGNIVESFTYDEHFGTIVEHTKLFETDNPYAYTGREYDTPELYYYRARYYDPTIQRFISEDPIGFASGDYNFYRYVWNSPVNFVDPCGLFDVNSGFGGGAGVMLGLGGVNAHVHFNCSSDGCFVVTTICGRIGLGIGFNIGAEGNAGFNPNGVYGKDCDGEPKECKYDWSIGVGADLHFGPAGGGGSVAIGPSGVSVIGDIPVLGLGLDIGFGLEACLIISCPF